jgi:hypothetical protein
MEFYDFPYVLGIIKHPNWRTHIFQMGWNHQPVNNVVDKISPNGD